MNYTGISQKLLKLHILKRIFIQKMANDNLIYQGQFPILKYIRDNEGCTQAEIAEYLFVTPASIATSTKRLQTAGLILKKNDKENLRCKRLSITELGLKSIDEHKKILEKYDQVVYDGIDKEDLATLDLLLEKVICNIEKNAGQDIKEIEKICASLFNDRNGG